MEKTNVLYGIGIVIALLLFATLISFTLCLLRPHNETFSKVKVIVKSWWLIATPFLAVLYLGPVPLMVLFFVISCFGMREFIRHSRFTDLRRPLTALVIVVTSIQYFLLYSKLSVPFLIFIPLSFIWIIPALLLLKPDVRELPALGALVLGALLFSYYLSYLPALPWIGSTLWPHLDIALVALLVLVFLTESNDVFQFLSGKAFGRRKIVPLISPNKTEAGFLGGLILTTLLSTFFASSLLEITHIQAMLLGATVSLTGMLGDLLFSGIKRYFGVKDFSDLIPGHGGLLDRLDSLILTAPAFFHIVFFFKGGSF